MHRRGAGRPTVAGHAVTTAVRLAPRRLLVVGGGGGGAVLKRDPARSKTLEDFEKRFKSFFDRLIPFPEIADWYSDLRRNTTSKEAGLAEAFEMLKCDLLAGASCTLESQIPE